MMGLERDMRDACTALRVRRTVCGTRPLCRGTTGSPMSLVSLCAVMRTLYPVSLCCVSLYGGVVQTEHAHSLSVHAACDLFMCFVTREVSDRPGQGQEAHAPERGTVRKDRIQCKGQCLTVLLFTVQSYSTNQRREERHCCCMLQNNSTVMLLLPCSYRHNGPRQSMNCIVKPNCTVDVCCPMCDAQSWEFTVVHRGCGGQAREKAAWLGQEFIGNGTVLLSAWVLPDSVGGVPGRHGQGEALPSCCHR